MVTDGLFLLYGILLIGAEIAVSQRNMIRGVKHVSYLSNLYAIVKFDSISSSLPMVREGFKCGPHRIANLYGVFR